MTLLQSLRLCSTHDNEYSITNLYVILIKRSDGLVFKIVLKLFSSISTEYERSY